MGLNIPQAAEEIGGITPQTLRRWEKGSNISPGNHRKYQQALHRWQTIIDTAHQ